MRGSFKDITVILVIYTIYIIDIIVISVIFSSLPPGGEGGPPTQSAVDEGYILHTEFPFGNSTLVIDLINLF